jgi:hypothetical protein
MHLSWNVLKHGLAALGGVPVEQVGSGSRVKTGAKNWATAQAHANLLILTAGSWTKPINADVTAKLLEEAVVREAGGKESKSVILDLS